MLTTFGLPITAVIAPVNGPPALAVAWECDLCDDSLRWTPGVFDLFGLERTRGIRRADIVAMYSPQSRATLERLRSHAIATLGSFTFEAEIKRADGKLCWLRVTADVLVRNGRATHLYGTKLDITAERLLPT